MIDVFRQDIRHAVRHLRRSPTFTLGAILTFALEIGVSAAVFSALNALVLGRRRSKTRAASSAYG
jgi:hypothetical protein